MEVMLARLRPDRARGADLIQHVVPTSPRNVPATISAFCRVVLRAVDLDPRCVDRLVGRPCPPCIASAPPEVVMYLTRVSGLLWPSESLGTAGEPVGPFVYASGLAGLNVRHIVPDNAPRFPHAGRLVVSVECGHMAWCPVAGPWPSTDWEVCAECLKVAGRNSRSCPAGNSPSP